jgi:ABC-type sugar transport system ATPase subunit
MTTVQLKNIAQSFAGGQVLRDISLRVESGSYVVLLGPSGCGKTTLLRIIAGLQTADQGDVLFDGTSVARLSPRQRDLSLVAQHDGLYPHRTVSQSMRLPLKGVLPADQIDSRIEHALRVARIEAIADRYPNRLSGGELRRAAIGKAVARGASVRLLDEPLSALDAPIRESLQDDLLRWHREFPGTTIHVTHDGQEAMRLADAIAVIDDGRIVQFAAPNQIYSDPATVTVAQSVGSPAINLLQCSIHNGVARSLDSGLELANDWAKNLVDGDVLIGIRPDAFNTLTQPNQFAFVGEVGRFHRINGGLQMEVSNGDSTIHAFVEEMPAREGESIRLGVSEEKVFVFEAGSGRRLT